MYTVESTGRHTCFDFSGIGDSFSRKDVKLRAIAPKMLFLDSDGTFHHRAGFFLPPDKRVGSAGVDHAFGAGFLEGLDHEKPLDLCLTQGLAVSTVSRRDLSPSRAITSLQESLRMAKE